MFRFVKGQQKNITQCSTTFFINFVPSPHLDESGCLTLAALVINSLHYVHVLFPLVMLFKSWMTEIFCPCVKCASFIRKIGIFTSRHLSPVVICLEPGYLPLFRKNTFFIFRFSMAFLCRWLNAKVIILLLGHFDE